MAISGNGDGGSGGGSGGEDARTAGMNEDG